MLVAAAVIGIFLPALFTVLNTGLTLFSKNHSLNQTHTQARMGIERMIEKVQASAERPRLTSANGVEISGEGPAPGVRFWRYISAAYELAENLNATDVKVKFIKKAGEPPITAGNMILFPDIGFQAVASSVEVSGAHYHVNLTDFAGNFLKTPVTTGVLVSVTTGLLNSVPKCRAVRRDRIHR